MSSYDFIGTLAKNIANIYFSTFHTHIPDDDEADFFGDEYYGTLENNQVRVEHLALNGYTLPAFHVNFSVLFIKSHNY